MTNLGLKFLKIINFFYFNKMIIINILYILLNTQSRYEFTFFNR